MRQADDLLELIASLRAQGAPFAVATVVRTVAMTAAKAGAKAVIREDGSISAGWIGGGCARAAVLRAARAAIADGRPRLISVQPPDVLQAQNIQPGDTRHGLEFARNLCPSQGTMDVFVEALLPRPELLICGASPVAVALADLAPRFGYAVRIAAPKADHAAFADVESRLESYDFAGLGVAERYVVVATQGAGDQAALRAASGIEARYVGFVGSRRKAAVLKQMLMDVGVSPDWLDALHAPAGLLIDAVTPEEIALSILAEITAGRRRRDRQQSPARGSD